MSDWRIVLANEFKKRNPKQTIGADLGSVVSVSPLIFEMLGGDIVLEEEDYKITKTFQRYLDRKEVREGDIVLIVATEKMTDFFVVDLI